MLYLTEEQVTGLVSIRDALEVVEAAFREQEAGTAVNLPRQRIRMPTGQLHLMAGALAGPQRFGFKAYTTFRGYIKFHVFLYDREHGNLLAIMEGDRLGQLRTGAATGVATKYLSTPLSSTLGVIGTGWQAHMQVRAICAVRDIRVLRVYSRDPERRRQFGDDCRDLPSLEVSVADSARAAVEGADIVSTITTAREPVLSGAWLAPGTHVNAAGSNSLIRRELDDAVVSRADFVCVDSLAQAQVESGDLLVPIEKGIITWDRIQELSEVIIGRYAGRKSTQDITLFKSHGIAIEDIALAALVYQRAREQQIGTEIAL